MRRTNTAYRTLAASLATLASCTFGGDAGPGGAPDLDATSTAGAGTSGSATSLTAAASGAGPGADTSAGLDDDPMADSSGSGAPDPDSSTSGGGSGTTDVSACVPQGWWDDAWSHRREIHLDNTDIGEALSNFPVLVRLNAERIDYAQTQDDGADLRFVDVDGVTVLDHEIEVWDEVGDSFVWLRVPQIPPQGERTPVFHVYFGNATAADASAPAGVWSNGYVSVHHMGTMTDSTMHGHDGIAIGGPGVLAGRVGAANSFDGIDDHIALPGEADFDFGGSMTVEVLAQPVAFSVEWQAIVTKGDDAWRLHRSGTQNTVAFSHDVGISNFNLSAGVAVDDGAWHGIAASFGGDKKRMFVDGIERASQTHYSDMNKSNDEVLIGENASSPGRFFGGLIDEVRISGTGRSQTWLTVSHRAMLDLGVVLYGAQETCGG